MIKTMLFASAAALAVAVPANAQEIDASLTFNNTIDTRIVTDVEYTQDVDLVGDLTVTGNVDVDSAATAVSDVKQITDGEAVLFDDSFVDENNNGLDDDDEATALNRAGTVDVDADGNVGVNSAAGQYNSQANVATIAVADNDDGNNGGGNGEEDGGMATANTTSAQSLTNTYYGPELTDFEDDPYTDDNRALVGDVDGNGNIGVNAAAGAFNQQQNIMTLAVATDSSLASASAGVVQFSNGNLTMVNDSTNITNAGLITGAGNIGVNMAAGVGNQQHNSLTVAASSAFGGNQ